MSQTRVSRIEERAKRRAELDAKVPIVDLRDGARGVGIWAQTIAEELHPGALEILGEARRIAEKLDDKTITAVVVGKKRKETCAAFDRAWSR